MTRDSDATPIPWGARAMRSSASLRGVWGGLGLRRTRFEKRIPSVYYWVRECTFHGTVVRTKRCRGPDDFGGKIFDKTKKRSNPFSSSIRSSSCRGLQLFGRPRIQSAGAYTLHTRTMGVVGRDNYHQPADICSSPRYVPTITVRQFTRSRHLLRRGVHVRDGVFGFFLSHIRSGLCAYALNYTENEPVRPLIHPDDVQKACDTPSPFTVWKLPDRFPAASRTNVRGFHVRKRTTQFYASRTRLTRSEFEWRHRNPNAVG